MRTHWTNKPGSRDVALATYAAQDAANAGDAAAAAAHLWQAAEGFARIGLPAMAKKNFHHAAAAAIVATFAPRPVR
jgi:hypothetical protein